MHGEQKLIYVRGVLLQAEIEMNAMIAENKHRDACGDSPAYVEKDFMQLIEKYNIHDYGLTTALTD